MQLPKTVAETWQLQKEKSDYRHEFINAWKLDELDCVICPVHTLPAIKLGSSRKMLPNVSYTALYNLLDFPAGVAPVTLVRMRCIVPPCAAAGWDTERTWNTLALLFACYSHEVYPSPPSRWYI